MRSYTFLCVVVICVAEGRAASGASTAECLRNTTRDVLVFQRAIMRVTINREILQRGLVSHRKPIASLVEDIFKDVAVASREMSKATSAEDLTLRKGRGMKVLDAKAPTWTARMEQILDNPTEPPETKKAVAAGFINHMLSPAGSRVLSGIERSAKECF